MKKILLINGCSHSCGCEITPDTYDTKENREKSFGEVLAKQLGRTPINLAVPGGSNDWIARTTAAWISDHLNAIKNKELDVICLIHWTGTERWEYRFPHNLLPTPFIDYIHDISYKNFTANQIIPKTFSFESKLIKWFQRVFSEDDLFWSDNKMKNIIFTQELLKNNGCKYWFGNAFDSVKESQTSKSLKPLLDETYFPYFFDNNKSYFWYCFYNGFGSDDLTKPVWHLSEEAHKFYSNFLLEEFKKVNLQ